MTPKTELGDQNNPKTRFSEWNVKIKFLRFFSSDDFPGLLRSGPSHNHDTESSKISNFLKNTKVCYLMFLTLIWQFETILILLRRFGLQTFDFLANFEKVEKSWPYTHIRKNSDFVMVITRRDFNQFSIGLKQRIEIFFSFKTSHRSPIFD